MPELHGWKENSFVRGWEKSFSRMWNRKYEDPEGGKGSHSEGSPAPGRRSHPPSRTSRDLDPRDPLSGAAPLAGTLRKVSTAPAQPPFPPQRLSRDLASPVAPPHHVAPPPAPPRPVAPPRPAASAAPRTRPSLARVRAGAPAPQGAGVPCVRTHGVCSLTPLARL